MKGFKHLPGPKSYPLIGNLLGYHAPGIGRDPKKSPQIWKYFNQVYGPLVRLDLPGADPMVLVFDPGYAEQVYRNEGYFPNRPGFESLGQVRKSMVETGGLKGLIPSQGEEWKEFRTKVQYSLLHPKVIETFTTVIHEISAEFTEHVASFGDNADFTQVNTSSFAGYD